MGDRRLKAVILDRAEEYDSARSNCAHDCALTTRPAQSSAVERLAGAFAENFGESPIDDECLAKLAEHDIRRLNIAMQNAPIVRKGNRLANG